MKTLTVASFLAAFALILTSTAAHATWTAAELDKAVSKANWTHFDAACKKHHIAENCEFLRGAHDYKHQDDASKRGMLAAGVMEAFVGAGTHKEVNLPAAKVQSTRAAYDHAKAAKSYPANLFDEAVTEIGRMLIAEFINGPVRTADFEAVRSHLQ